MLPPDGYIVFRVCWRLQLSPADAFVSGRVHLSTRAKNLSTFPGLCTYTPLTVRSPIFATHSVDSARYIVFAAPNSERNQPG